MFHTPIEDKDAERTAEELLEAINNTERPSSFVGAQFEALDLADETLGSSEEIDLRGVMVRNDVDLRDVVVEAPLRIDSGSIGGDLLMQRLESRGGLSCRDLQTGGQWLLYDATIDGRLDAAGYSGTSLIATGIHVADGVSVRKGVVESQLDFTQARVEGPVWLSHTRVTGHLDLGAAVFHDRLSLSHCQVAGNVVVRDTTVENGFSLEHLHVSETFDATQMRVSQGIEATSSQFDGEADFTEIEATGGRLDFDYSLFGEAVYFDMVTIASSRLSFQNAQFRGETVSFVWAAISGTLSFSGAHFTAGSQFRMVESSVGKSIVCDHASVDGEVYWKLSRVHDNVDFSDCTVTSLVFGVEIGGNLDFAYTYVADRTEFGEAIVHGDARFTGAQFDNEPMLTDATVEGSVAAYGLSVQTTSSE
ncbi:hypothetical protein [Haloferax profundi]|uniref:Pentapeptide repeat-containing protein n=1 Tax=Haloferax profundi TaxID=1544718 RepID=A0A0W1SVD9_9EURY|nr:hypothetical protein [Haloferax profundi]KTG30390.1 hypothetical protein AUR66_08150 [Haloferax profundi]